MLVDHCSYSQQHPTPANYLMSTSIIDHTRLPFSWNVLIPSDKLRQHSSCGGAATIGPSIHCFANMDSKTPAATPTNTTGIYSPPPETHSDCPLRGVDCEHCNWNYYTIAAQKEGTRLHHGSLTPEDAQVLTNNVIRETRKNLSDVKDKLQTHGDLILSRWSKKSKDKRGALLSTAAELCFGPWPPVSCKDPMPEDCCLLWIPEKMDVNCSTFAPWMRVTNFAEDRKRLLTLLHLRTEHSLQSWAMHDTMESEVAFTLPGYLPYSPCCVQMFGEDYGRVVEFDHALLHTWAIMSFSRALTTIRAHQLISIALVQVVDKIIADASPSGNSKWEEFVINCSRKGSESRWSFYEHPALTVPCGFDTQILLDKATSKFNELVDDMELLQTDPEYALAYFLRHKASVRCKDSTPTTTKWKIVAGITLGTLAVRLRQWARVIEACQVLHDAFEKHRDHIKPGSVLPAEVGRAMSTFATFTDSASRLEVYVLNNALYHMAAFKDYFTIVESGGSYMLRHLGAFHPNKQGDSILAMVTAVQSAMEENKVCGARLAVQILLEQLESVGYDKDTDEELSSIALLDEMRLAQIWSQLGPFKTQSPGADNLTKGKAVDESCSSAPLTSPRNSAASRVHLDSINDPSQNRLGLLLRRFCEAPWPKDHKSSAWLDKVSESRKCLSAFWQAYREEWGRNAERRGPIHPKDEQLTRDFMSFDTSPEYLNEVQKEREQGEAEIRNKKTTQPRQHIAPQDVQTTWGSSMGSDGPANRNGFNTKKRTKVKTTGVRVAELLGMSTLSLRDDDRANTGSDDVATQPSRKPIPVKPESLKVLKMMFASSTQSTSGSVRWINLVQALADAGLVTTQASGSAVTFTSSDQGSINFHKPHPEPVVDGFMLRCMGKRLRKWFGWERDRFVLRAKEGNDPPD